MALDPRTYLAVISFEIPKTIFLPVESVAGIVGNGLLGAKFLNLIPGGIRQECGPWMNYTNTQPSVSLESLIVNFLFNTTQSSSKTPQKSLLTQ